MGRGRCPWCQSVLKDFGRGCSDPACPGPPKPVASDPKCEFDPATHTYRIDGKVVPSVTQVLQEAGLIDTRWYTDEARERGQNIHTITELWDRGTLKTSAVPEELRGYLAAWRKFLGDTGAEVVENECQVWNTLYMYGGTLDRKVIWNKCDWIGDIKSGAANAWEAYQTAAYAGAMPPDRPPPRRFAIHLRPNGTYVPPREHKDFKHDFDVFRAALVIANETRGYLRTGDMNDNSSCG